MVKKIFPIALIIVFLTGCAEKNIVKEEISKLSVEKFEKEKRVIVYGGGYDVDYEKPRVVWFKPLLTNNGNVLSERTLTIGPKKFQWKQKKKSFISDKFEKFVEEGVENNEIN